MNDHDDRQAQYAFADGYKALVVQKKYMQGSMPEAYGGVSAQVMRVVWRCYADFADWGTGASSYPSHGQVADLTGCSRRQVQRAVQALTDTGWLIKTREATKTHAAHYTVSLRGMDTLSTHDTLSPDNTSTHDITSIGDMTPCHLTTRHEVTTRPLGIDNTSTGYRHHDALPYQEPYQEPVETRAHEPARTTPPPEDRVEGTSSVGSSDIDPAAMDGLILDMFDRYGRAMEIGIAGGLHHTLRDKGLSNRQVLAYLEERLIEFGVSDYDTKAAVRYIIRDAAKWLADVTPPRRPEISQAQLDAEDAYDRQCAEDYAMIQSFTPAAKLLWDQAVQRTWERSMDGIDHPPEDLHALKLKLYAMSQESTR